MKKVICKNCDWKWDIEKDDKNPYLCHKCGYDNKKNEFDHKSFKKWKSDNKIKESTIKIRKIIREVLLEEFKPKTPLGKGKDHVVYDYEGDPNKVIKVAWGSDGNKYDPNAELKQVDLDPSHIKAFQDNPDLFAKVHKFTNRYAIIDKLNTESIKSDQSEIFKILEPLNIPQLDHFNEHNAIGRLYWLSSNRKGFHVKLVRKLVETGVFFESTKLQLYIDFIRRIIESPLGKEKKNLDVNDANIGYDPKGGLKLLDF